MINARSEGIINLEGLCFHIVGCGAIGSSTALQLLRMGASSFYLYDFDKVELHNLGVSEYIIDDVGKCKVEALNLRMRSINESIFVNTFNEKLEDYYPNYSVDKNIVILGVDSMSTRLEIMEIICSHVDKPDLVIDGRMGSEQFQQYVFKNVSIKKYKKTWYSDKESDTEPCNMKATSYCSNMSGSFICNAIRKYVTKQPYEKELIFNFPGMILDFK